jgi:site-specific recombinase XerD
LFARYLADIGLFSFFAATTEIVRAFYRSLQESDLCRSVIHRRAHAVYAFYAWLQLEGYLLLNPCPKPPRSQSGTLPRAVPELDRIQSVYRRLAKTAKPHEQRDFAMIDLAYDTGLRRCELHRLNVRDIDPENATVRVHGKADHRRLVPIGPACLRELLHYIYEVRPKLAKESCTDALFVSWREGGKRMNLESINAAFSRLRRKYGFDRSITPHALRHAFATGLVINGAPVQDVSRMLGHKKLETTQIYTRLAPRDLKAHHARYHPRG